MRKCIDLLEQSPLITGVAGVIVGVGGMKILGAGDGNLLKMFALRAVLFLAMCVFVYLISREKPFENCHTSTGYVVRWELLTMIPYVIMLPLQFTMEEGSIVPDWPIKLILSIILSVFIGLYEETVFRVIINDAILYKFRNSKYVFAWIAVISSLVFGVVHTIGADYSSVSAYISAGLKTVQTGLVGFCLLILYWKTRNIWGIALAHALYDGLSIVPKSIYEGATKGLGSAKEYVNLESGGNMGYFIFIVPLTIAAIILWKKVGKKIDFDEIRKTW
ncbi:MAG: CPBP family intramembrane metalloprotease [Lachnospiraceae bacterium]|nr:CPBP family intramembrane metalloprotease [Lachnospiraceae bacterium]